MDQPRCGTRMEPRRTHFTWVPMARRTTGTGPARPGPEQQPTLTRYLGLKMSRFFRRHLPAGLNSSGDNSDLWRRAITARRHTHPPAPTQPATFPAQCQRQQALLTVTHLSLMITSVACQTRTWAPRTPSHGGRPRTAAPRSPRSSAAQLAMLATRSPTITAGTRAVIRDTFATSAAQQTRGRLNMQPPGLNIYASQSRTENARSCREWRGVAC